MKRWPNTVPEKRFLPGKSHKNAQSSEDSRIQQKGTKIQTEDKQAVQKRKTIEQYLKQFRSTRSGVKGVQNEPDKGNPKESFRGKSSHR